MKQYKFIKLSICNQNGQNIEANLIMIEEDEERKKHHKSKTEIE